MCQTARSHHPSFGYAARWSALAGVQLLVDRAGEHAVHSRTHDLQRRRQAGVLLSELRIQHHELAHRFGARDRRVRAVDERLDRKSVV